MLYAQMGITEYLDFSLEMYVHKGIPYVVKLNKIMKEYHTRELMM
jgi:hypothetical protein